ncbi:protein of unknown function [Vibrio tapetis subsp. tapetis]|uniref:Uncharacterized protein n=1 Tax=Vibrio tapetis subsp. tapetis TaxID=1671868 RepID=A0A2N8ZM42_9VIBR|nr:protein of unknown function [Vibrio tapetis subsp. tapetis]
MLNVVIFKGQDIRDHVNVMGLTRCVNVREENQSKAGIYYVSAGNVGGKNR